ncbi:MAG: potassium channel family protein [Arenicellales bacterium]
MEFTIAFVKTFYLAVKLGAPLLLTDIASILILGLIVGRLEKWKPGEAIYWSCMTVTTVGYGDFHPARGFSRFLAILIAVHGLIIFAILGSVAVQATLIPAETHIDVQAIRSAKN